MSEVKHNTLEPLGSLSMTDRVENILREYFTENGFKPGDSLPKEMEISQKLNVGRNVVREALSRLRMLGMIETRPRRGMIMAQPDLLAGIEKVLNPLLLSQDNLKDIFELRLILEMGISEFLFARKTDKDLAELEDIVSKQKDAVVVSKEEEVAFHGKLYEMTGNDTFKRFQNLLMPVFEHVFTEYYDKGIHRDIPNPVTHHDLFVYLKQGTQEEFRKAMYQHLEVYFKTITAR
ncbi:FadR/GntR family transcriptional regulator [Dyadobacter frigoris]|uniref:FadR family transcriptional regulator n=1 Tax=Dyadobacter frigoris TaxID=2576211 RepID=A0A4U6D267_9BACT|nr:GntR family transcriptional regulator [Dyadobacter frigoris]TKT87944.1 FadR family transcriptional regulator [Dyadobacter frigoris]GLU52837.1 GntR family transcriptional regulator [Dyadobacter frigoris]